MVLLSILLAAANPNSNSPDGLPPSAAIEEPKPLAANPPPNRPATAAEQARAKAAFDNLLMDGPTARWDFLFVRANFLICGRVNAKNSFGAYVGWKPFTFDLTKGSAETYDDEHLWFYKFLCFNIMEPPER